MNARGPDDRAVDVTLGGEVHDALDVVAGEDIAHHRRIANVAVHEAHALAVDQIENRREVAGVGEGVQDHQPRRRRGAELAHEVAADESCTAGDQPGAHAGILTPPASARAISSRFLPNHRPVTLSTIRLRGKMARSYSRRARRLMSPRAVVADLEQQRRKEAERIHVGAAFDREARRTYCGDQVCGACSACR